MSVVAALAIVAGLSAALAWQASASAVGPPNSWALLAAGERTVVLGTETGLNATIFNNGTYFYNDPGRSMGFAPNSTITQGSADVTNSTLGPDTTCTSANGGDLRLSWHRSEVSWNITGGWRYGCVTHLNSDNSAVRAVFQSNSPSYYPSGPQKNINHSLLLNSGWEMCFIGGYGTAVTFSSVANACTQPYIILAGGTGGSVPVLATPTISAHTAGLTTISLTFSAVANASSYTAYLYSTASGGAPVVTVTNYTSGATISGLTSSTTYYATLQAVGDNASFASSGESDPRYSLTTLSTLPVITSTSVSGITMTGADVTATVTTSQTSVTARGFVIATTDTPVIGGDGVTAVPSGAGTGPMSAAFTGLEANTTYYVRAYATNTGGTAYGATQVFTSAPNAIATSAGTVRWFEGPTVIDGALSVDGEPLQSATVSIDDNRAGDLLACPDTTGSGITCAFDEATGVLSLSGSATAATYRSVLRGVTFETTDIKTDVTVRTITFDLGGGVIPPVTRTVSPLPAQSIAFSPAETLVYGDAALTLTASSTSGLTVDLTVTSGEGVTCTLTGLTLSWTGVGACTVTASQAGVDTDDGFQPAPDVVRTITMARRPLPISGITATPRVYDGTTTVSITGSPTIDADALLPADVGSVTAGGSPIGSLPSASAGTDRSVTVSGITLSGARAFAYELPEITIPVDIAPREVRLTGSFTVSDRAYDGTTDVVADTQSLSLRSSDLVDGDAASLALGTVTFVADSADAGLRTATPSAALLTGARASDYRVVMTDAPTATFTIVGVALTVASGSFTVADKVYDGSTTATILTNDLVLTGFVGDDSMADLEWTPTGAFLTTTAGIGRVVELTGGAVFGGPRGTGYTLDVTGAPTATATITPRPVTVTGAGAATRPYDGTTAVTITGATLANTVAGDTVTLAGATTGTATSRDAGTRSVATAMTLAGADAANYRLAGQPVLSITITPLPVSVSMNPLPSRPYDGTAAIPLTAGAFTVSGVLPGESIAVSGTGQLSSRAAGTRTVTLTSPTFTPGGGTSLANYTLPASVAGTLTVTPLTLQVTGASVTGRAWDGTDVATVTGATLAGARGGDNVSLSGADRGTFASAQPGTHAVTFAPTLVGVDAINYRLEVPALSGTISRAPATLRITGGLSQIADGSPRSVRAAVSPASAGRVVISYDSGVAPSAPGSSPVTVTLESATHEAAPLSATLTIQPLETLLPPAIVSTAAPEDAEANEAHRGELLARIAVRPDGTLALPEIGPVLEEDGSNPAFAPRDHRVLEDGEPSDARVIVVEDQRIRIETADDSLALELQASVSTPDGRVPLPVDADGTLLLDRGGFVEVGGSGFLAGSTAEVWMFSTATFLGTAIVGADGSFDGAFLIDDLLAAGDHTIQLNGTGADQRVRSTSMGVRIDDPDAPARERVVIASATGSDTSTLTSPLWLLLLAALLGAGVTRWWLAGRRRSEDEDAEVVEREPTPALR